MIIARTEQEIDRILDHFIADGFISCTRGYKPDLNQWRDFIKEEYLNESETGIVIFVPNWDYDLQQQRVVKTLNWHVAETLEQFLKEENNDND